MIILEENDVLYSMPEDLHLLFDGIMRFEKKCGRKPSIKHLYGIAPARLKERIEVIVNDEA